MLIRYVAPALCPDGYGEFSRYVVSSLHRSGHEISITTFLHNQAEPASRFGEKGLLAESLIERGLPSPPEINIVNSTPRSFSQYRISGSLNVGFTMYEAEHIDPTAVLACNAMDAILVPSELNRVVFSKSGVQVPVFVVHPSMTSAPSDRIPHEKFVFYSVFEWNTPHKDPKSLLSAYLLEFGPEEPVLLRVKTFERTRIGAIESDVQKIKKELGITRAPKIELVIGSLTNSEMWDYYGRADAYISSHHGEGWGMPIWEAMATGLPTIATGYGANMEFMRQENSYPVSYSYDPKRMWANIDVQDLRKKMRQVYEDQEASKKVGQQARSDILLRPEESSSMVMNALHTMRAA